MYLGAMAQKYPEKPAILYQDTAMTYAELDARSNRLAHLFRSWGLQEGDSIAVLIGNEPCFYEFFWAAMRSGLYFTPINTHLAPGEMAYIANDCDAMVLAVAGALRDAAAQFAGDLPKVEHRIIAGDTLDGFESYPAVVADMPATPIADEREGTPMLYSSGTTGRPKGVRRPLLGVHPSAVPQTAIAAALILGYRTDDRYLNVGPLYHAAPLTFSAVNHRIGSTVVLMPRFDAADALYHIEHYRSTISQWVPTHFVRLLHLPPEVRSRYDLSSHRLAIHAAAPCPVEIKRQMIDWWGNIIVEYYAGTEGGGTLVRAEEWLKRPGTVGRHWTGGKVWVLDENGNEAPVGQPGLVFFESTDPSVRFAYHKDAQKTAQIYRGDLFTIGDIGYLDSDGYLFLTDRQSYMIISGGVNIYPAEVESVLIMHPAVEDVAVIGIPDAEMGEQVKAIVQLRDDFEPSAALADDIMEHSRKHIARFKAPRSVDFIPQMPRSAAGKLMKRELKAQYWGK
jgi:fatty-acyl-CoA synthase